MRILDRYILKTYLLNWGILLSVIMIIYVLIQLLVELDEFVQAGQKRAQAAAEYGGIMPGQEWFWLLYSIVDFTGPTLLLIFTFLNGLIAAAAVGFTFAILNRSGELLAMLTAGISMYRIAAPALIAGILLSAISLPLQEFVIPGVAQKILRSPQTMHLKTIESKPIYLSPDEAGHLLSFAQFDPLTQTAKNISVLYRQDGQATGAKLIASAGQWDDSAKAWRLTNPVLEEVVPGQSSEKRRISFENGYPLKTSLTPEVLLIRRNSRAIQLLSYRELNQMQQNPGAGPYRDNMLLAMHTRLSMFITQALILLLTMPFFLQREQGYRSLQAVKAATVCLGAWIGAVVLIYVIGQHLNPMAAAWLPVAIYLPLSALLAQTTRS